MRVFILCTGRTGSTSIIKACEHIDNFSSGHETLARKFGKSRFDFPDHHIEADNRLSWEPGKLDQNFGDEPYFVHLKRQKERVAESYFSRYFKPESIMDAYCSGVKMTPAEKLSDQKRYEACLDYIETVDSNISFFLSNKSKVLTMHLENIEEDFRNFWNEIGAKGDFNAAIAEFQSSHNASRKRDLHIRYRLRLAFLREWKHLRMAMGK